MDLPLGLLWVYWFFPILYYMTLIFLCTEVDKDYMTVQWGDISHNCMDKHLLKAYYVLDLF